MEVLEYSKKTYNELIQKVGIVFPEDHKNYRKFPTVLEGIKDNVKKLVSKFVINL